MGRDHWFDRLTAPHTRRTSLKALAAGIGGAAVATLPAIVKPESAAAAEGPQACRKGCLYVSRRIWAAGVGDCGVAGTLEYSIHDLLIHGPVTPFLVPIANLVYAARTKRCFDAAAAQSAAAAAPCMEPNCPNFDPTFGPYAPCDCAPGYYCYPCEATTTGYICCVYKPGDCHGDCCTAGNCPPGI
jgi:hypothetical protein